MTTTLQAAPTTPVNKWKPNPGPQTFALRQPPTVFEIMYGGQRGGGKTDAGMVWSGHRRWKDSSGNWQAVFQHPKYRALVIRKNADDLSDWIERFRFMYQGTGCKIGYQPAIIRFPSGALIRTGHLKDDQAYTKYQGHEYQSILIEELTQIPTEKRYIQLISSCRSTTPEIRPQVFTTTNPGGHGHAWVKERFVSPAEPMTVFSVEGNNRIFIPAGIEDNPTLVEHDPGYVQRLEEIKHVDYELYKAWRLGSWDVFAGQAFREFDYAKHVIDGIHNKMEYSLDVCEKIITFDWGYRDKAAAHWLALTPENRYGVRHVYVYREIIRTETDPDEWAAIIKKFTDIEPVKYMVLPHDCFAHKQSKTTIASTFSQKIKINIRRGDTLAQGARLNRKAMLHLYLGDSPDGTPYMSFHPTCKDAIKTIPLLQYDERHVEDIDTTQDDHSYDSVTLGLVSLGYRPRKSELLLPRAKVVQTFPTWNTNQQGNITAPNFWQEFDRQKSIKPHDAEYM
jgi:hypothetical protein